jgi:hypothetical protein
MIRLTNVRGRDPTVGAQYRWAARHCPQWMNAKLWGLLQGMSNQGMKQCSWRYYIANYIL